jgi:Smg protein
MMNEVLQVLMYFFEKIGEALPAAPNEQFILSELQQLGVPLEEVRRMLAWMEDIVETKRLDEYPLQKQIGTRIFTDIEESRMNKKCRSLLLQLEQEGILSPTTRELVLDHLLQLPPREITLQRVKWITLMVLCEQTDKLSAAHMERFLLKESSYQLH